MPTHDTRLDEVCRERGMWSSAAHPGVCWILENVLGIDPTWVTYYGFSLEGYESFVPNMDGEKIFDSETREFKKEYHYWTEEQLDKLDEWLDFIPDRFKVTRYAD